MWNEDLFIHPEEQLWCKKNDVRLLSPSSPEYPTWIAGQFCRPQALYVKGEPVWENHLLISVVGSRHPTQASLIWLEDVLSELIVDYGIVPVSGGARGIDQKAHQVALRHQRPTIVFMPAGLAQPYPRDFSDWYEPILRTGGAVISQFSPFMPMKKSYFHERNKLIAAISPMTLVVECRERSGTLLTANCALEYGREIAIMPTAPYSAGLGGLDMICKRLAHPVRNAHDIMLIYAQTPILPDAIRQKHKISEPTAQAGGQMSFPDNGLAGHK